MHVAHDKLHACIRTEKFYHCLQTMMQVLFFFISHMQTVHEYPMYINNIMLFHNFMFTIIYLFIYFYDLQQLQLLTDLL